mmetsp:Transcript_46201/g.142470  ORF Transcript_46201/g.142470 Transcript_46201/m.142470 type:complete len:408 (-) Transcript_46201:517-1740(-)
MLVRRLRDAPALQRPELAEQAERGGLAAAVGADDQQVHPRADEERQGLDQDGRIGRHDRHLLEFDGVTDDDGAVLRRRERGRRRRGRRIRRRGRRRRRRLPARARRGLLDRGDALVELADAVRVARDARDGLVRQDQRADRLRKVRQEAARVQVQTGELTRVELGGLRAEVADRAHGVADHHGAVLDQEAIEDRVARARERDGVGLAQRGVEEAVERAALVHLALRHDHFLGVREQMRVPAAEVALHALLLVRHRSERRREQAHQDRDETVPRDDQPGRLVTAELGDLVREEHDVDDGLEDGRVEARRVVGPPLDVLRHALVDVVDAAETDAAEEGLLRQVPAVEVLRQVAAEGDLQQRRHVLDAAVAEGRRDGPQREDYDGRVERPRLRLDHALRQHARHLRNLER